MFRVMSKKIIWVLVFAIFSLICFFPVEGYANQDILKLGGISLDMPEVSVEIRGDVTSENISAALGGKTLVVDSAERYDSKIHSVRTYILVDVSSGTTPREYLDRVKVFVKSYAENMGANDKIILLSMGESTHEAASVSGADDKNSFYEKVDSLVCDEPHTQVYDAIYTAFEMAEQDANVSFDRDIILAFTDFVNDMTDGNGVALPGKSMNSLLSDFDISTMPVYATYRGLDADELSAAGESVDKSNGQFFEIGYFFDNIEICMDIVNDVSIIKMHAEDEADFANSQVCSLEIKIGDKTVSHDVAIENENRVLTEHETEQEPISTEEPVEVQETITEGDDKEDSDAWLIAVIVISTIFIIAAVVIVIVVVTRKHEPDDVEMPIRQNVPVQCEKELFEHFGPSTVTAKHHIKVENSARLRMHIKTGKTQVQDIEMTVVSSIIVGRSDICDVYVDDAKLSRQHFAIEYVNGVLFVKDLQSRNGTILNGSRVGDRQVLHSGDKITAGLTDIFITF